MRKLKIEERQTLFDIALEYGGDIEAAFELMRINDLSLTAELPAGTVVLSPEAVDAKIADFYGANNVRPATGVVDGGDDVWQLISNDAMDIFITNDTNQNIIANGN
jgi:hypothetical protein